MAGKEKNFVSAVVYVHDAEERIGDFLREIMGTLEEHFEHSEIICVNDHSTDGSADIVRELGRRAEGTEVTLLNLSYFHGLELAMNAGSDLAIGDFILEFDSTILDFGAEEILEVYGKALEGFDIVSAVPNGRERLSSKMFYRCFDHFAGRAYQMRTERFRILSRRVVNRIGEMNSAIPYRKALYANCGLRTVGVVYSPGTDRTVSRKGKKRDGYERRYRFRLAADALLLFTDMGYRFSLAMTLLMMLIVASAAVYAIVVYLTSGPVAGWTTTILFLSVAFFGVFGLMTVIIKYLQILVDLVFRRKRYSFESIEKLTGGRP